MQNESVKIVKRGDVYVLSMLKGQNKFNPTFMAHMNEAFDFLEKFVCLVLSPQSSHI